MTQNGKFSCENSSDTQLLWIEKKNKMGNGKKEKEKKKYIKS